MFLLKEPTDNYLVGVITDEKILDYDMQTLSQSEYKGYDTSTR